MRQILNKYKNILLVIVVFIAVYVLAQSTSTVLREYNSMEFLNSSNKLTLRGIARDFWLFPDNKSLTYYDGGTNIGISPTAVSTGLIWNPTNRSIRNAYYPDEVIITNNSGALKVKTDNTTLSVNGWSGSVYALGLDRINAAKVLAGLKDITPGSQHHTSGLITDDEKNANGGTTGAKVLKVNIDNETIKLNNNKQITVNTNLIPTIYYGYNGLRRYTNNVVVEFDCRNNTGERSNIIDVIKQYEGDLNGYTCTFKFKWRHAEYNNNLAGFDKIIGAGATNVDYDFDLRNDVLNFKNYFCGRIYIVFECLTSSNDININNTYKIGNNDWLYTGFLRVSGIRFGDNDYLSIHYIHGNSYSFSRNDGGTINNYYVYPMIVKNSADGDKSDLIFNQTIYTECKDLIILNFVYLPPNANYYVFKNTGLFLEVYNVFFACNNNGVNPVGFYTERGVTYIERCQTMYNMPLNPPGFTNLAPNILTKTDKNGITKLGLINEAPWGFINKDGLKTHAAHSVGLGGILSGPNGLKDTSF